MKHAFLPGLALVALSACTTITFDENTSTEAEFDAQYARHTARDFSIAPVTGSATYEGEVQIDTMGGTTTNGSIRGTLAMDVSFTASDPIDVAVGGFAGEIDGERVTFSGTLTDDKAKGLIPLNTLLPNPASPLNSAMWVTIGGTLRNNETGVRNVMQGGTRLTGNFYGPLGTAVAGEARMVIDARGGTSAITGTANEATVTGEWYAVQ